MSRRKLSKLNLYISCSRSRPYRPFGRALERQKIYFEPETRTIRFDSESFRLYSVVDDLLVNPLCEMLPRLSTLRNDRRSSHSYGADVVIAVFIE